MRAVNLKVGAVEALSSGLSELLRGFWWVLLAIDTGLEMLVS